MRYIIIVRLLRINNMTSCLNHQKCINTAIKNAEEICSNLSIKFTPLRREILKLIWESHVPIKAYDIIHKLKKELNSIKPITVYRILDVFLENNLIHKIESQNSFVGCGHPGEKHYCFFIICIICKKVEEGCTDLELAAMHKNMIKKEFKISSINLEIHGVCKDCAHLDQKS